MNDGDKRSTVDGMAVLPRPPDRRRIIPVRLPEIPLERRLKAAEQCCRVETDPLERIAVMTCAHHPSDRTYYIAA